MDYAIQLLLPVIGGLMLGVWLTNTYGASPIWTVVLAVLGMVGGIGVMYKRFTYPQEGSQTNLTVPKASMKTLPKKTTSSRPTSEQSSQSGVHVKDLDFLYQKYNDKPDDWKELDELDDQVDLEPPLYGHRQPAKPKNDPENHDL